MAQSSLLRNAIKGSQRLGPDQNQASPLYKPTVQGTINFPLSTTVHIQELVFMDVELYNLVDR